MGLLTACQSEAAVPVEVDMPALKAPLATVAKARVFFAHQSVGRDILAGVAALAAESNVDLRVVEVRGDPPVADGPGLFHVNIGENGAPTGKIDAFVRHLVAAPPATYDVALLKLCYVDFDDMSPRAADELLERYAAAVASLKAQRPGLRVVHASAPLRAEMPGWKTPLKRLLGRDQYGDADNAVRNVYSEALRRRFGAAPLFDIAAVESTLGDGRRSGFERHGQQVLTLAAPYTHDGGHLNERGRRLGASAFVTAIAAALA